MTGCEEITVLMQRELDRDVSGHERERLLDHLQRCPDCSALFGRLKALSAELDQLPDVTPPINIVDSILPQLADLAPTPQAAAIAAVNRPARKEAPWFSWKLASGAAAAALIVAVFLFNTGKLKMDSAADQTAKAADMIKPQAASGAAKAGASSNESVPQSSAKGAVGTGAPQRDTSFDRNNVNNSQSSASAQTSPAAGMAPALTPSTVPAGDTAKGTALAPVPTETPAAMKSKAADTLTQPPAESVSGPSNSPAAIEEQGPNAALSAPAEADQPVAESKPEESAGFTSFAVPAAPPSPAETRQATLQATPPELQQRTRAPDGVPSPDGDKAALLMDGHVFITDNSGNPVFKSELVWQPVDRLTFDWRSATSVAYTVVRADESQIVYVIDLEARTEKTELLGTSTH